MGHAVSARRSLLQRAEGPREPKLEPVEPEGQPETSGTSQSTTSGAHGVLQDFDMSPTDSTFNTMGGGSGSGGDGALPDLSSEGSMADYEQISVVGRGAFAFCHVVRRKRDGALLVMKTMLMPLTAMGESDMAALKTEVAVMRRLGHDAIVRYVDSFVDEDKLRIVMEYATEGTLHHAVEKATAAQVPFPEELVWDWVVQLLLGLEYVHTQGIIHRDIKPLNLLITGSDKRTIKIADFGIAKVLAATDDMAHSMVGTPHYLSPEVCRGEAYDCKSDIWSLGCVVYEALALAKAFRGRSVPGLLMSILQGRYAEVPAHYSAELRLLVDAMLVLNAEERPTAQDLLALDAVKAHVQRWKETRPRPQAPRTPPASLNCVGRDDFERGVAAAMPLSPSEPPIDISLSFAADEETKRTFSGSGAMDSEDDSFFADKSDVAQAVVEDVRARAQRASSPSAASSRVGNNAWLLNSRAFRWGPATQSPELMVQLVEVDLAAVACGEGHFVARSTAGEVFVYGDNSEGQLGLPHLESTSAAEGEGEEDLAPVPRLALPAGARAVRVAAGERHSAAVTADGEVLVWGRGYGRAPTAVPGLSGATKVSCGRGDLVAALTADGDVFVSPGFDARVALPGPAEHLACGGFGNVAVLRDGRVFAFSGPGGEEAREVPVPAPATGVDVGAAHAAVVMEDGRVATWGAGAAGQLGLGEGVAEAAEPTVVEGLEGVGLVCCGGGHSMAVRAADGALFVWGAGGCRGTECRDDVWAPQRMLALGKVRVAMCAAGPEDLVCLVAPVRV